MAVALTAVQRSTSKFAPLQLMLVFCKYTGGKVVSSGDKKYFANPAKHFAVASSAVDPRLVELVRHLARVAADNDYKTLTETNKLRYDGPRKKGPKND